MNTNDNLYVIEKKNINILIISLIFYFVLYRLCEKKTMFNVYHSIIISSFFIFILYNYSLNKEVSIDLYKMLLYHEIAYNITDLILNSTRTKGKYIYHHLLLMSGIIISLVNDLEVKSIVHILGIIQLGNIPYHLARLKYIDNKFSFFFYLLSSIVALLFWFLTTDFNKLKNNYSLEFFIMNLSGFLIGLWRFKQSYVMYLKIYQNKDLIQDEVEEVEIEKTIIDEKIKIL